MLVSHSHGNALTHATGDGIRRAMQLLTQTGVGKGNGKVCSFKTS
jgi:hypothetical protein